MRKLLIFNCTSDRTGPELLASLLMSAGDLGIEQAIFNPNITYSSGQSKDETTNHMVDKDDLDALRTQHGQ